MPRFGFAERDITPDLDKRPYEMTGYGYNIGRFAESVNDPLAASALAIEGDDGQRAALCGVDLLGLDSEAINGVREAMRASMPDADDVTILVNTSHTHSGPVSAGTVTGAGKFDREYVYGTAVPRVASAITGAFKNLHEGEIGINRAETEGLSFNRVNGESHDPRVTSIQIVTEELAIAGTHFACHPVVLGPKSKVISRDFPGAVRDTRRGENPLERQFWLTGFAGDIDPEINRERKGATTTADVLALGSAIGGIAIDLRDKTRLEVGGLRTLETSVAVPVNLDFELDPESETEFYRELRKIPKANDMTPILNWLKEVAPGVNAYDSETLDIPVMAIALGDIVFLGVGAEIYNETGLAIESAFPELQIANMMLGNDCLGYVPPAKAHDEQQYAARMAAFLFKRPPFTRDSETVLRAGLVDAVQTLQKV